MPLTPQQQVAIDYLVANDGIIAVSAKAGTGKTSTLQALVAELRPKKAFYTAFNKAIVQEAVEKFPSSVECRTQHAFALRYVQPKKKIEDFTYLCIKEHLPYSEKRLIIDVMDDFFRSSSIDMYDFLHDRLDSDELTTIAIHYIEQMVEGKIPPTFNFLLKYLHLCLVEGTISISYDLVCLDECLPGHMFVDTSTGPRQISAVCKDLQKGKEVLVKSFNELHSIFEYKRAKNPIVSHNRETIRIHTEGLNKLDCTPNHPILTQRGYVRADELVIGKDRLILDTPNNQKAKLLPNYDQLQVILGSYLGDGNLSQRSIHNTYRLRLTQGIAQLDYLKWKAAAFSLVDTIHTGTSGYTGRKDIYHTNNTPTFALDDTPFNSVLTQLSELGLAIWVMDDGSVSDGRISIHSNSFTKHENELLAEMLLKRFNLHASVYKAREFYMLSFSGSESKKLINVIFNYIHKDLLYKFQGAEAKTRDLDYMWKPYGTNFVSRITAEDTTTVYDFEVEDNHNFITKKSKAATGIVVHNCQDTTEVMFEIFMLIDAPKKILVGDTHQNIYAFMKTVNAFELLHGIPSFPLTKSFRCSPEIASRIQTFGKTFLSSDFEYEGTQNKPDDTVTYIARTNSTLISRMHDLHTEGTSYTLIRDLKDIFALPIALVTAAQGKPVFAKKYKFLEKEYKNYTISNYNNFFSYLRGHVDDPETISALNLLQLFRDKGINIFDVLYTAKTVTPNPNIYIVTAHSYKGKEASTIYIEDDLNTAVRDIAAKGGPSTSEELQEFNLYYVAISRAKCSLLNAIY